MLMTKDNDRRIPDLARLGHLGAEEAGAIKECEEHRLDAGPGGSARPRARFRHRTRD